MKKLILLFFVLVACSSSSKKAESTAKDYSSSKFTLRPIRTVTLENGLKIFFIEDITLPRISFNMLVKAGLANEPKGLDGLNAFTASMLEQGTKKRSAMDLAEEFGQLGTELNVSPGADFTFVSLDSLSKDKEKALELFADVSMNPIFSDKEVQRIRSTILAQIQKKIDNPSSYTDDEFDRLIYGNHPYGKDTMGTLETVKKMKKADLIKHYLTWYRPNNSSIAIVGQFPKDFEKTVTDTFKGWAARPTKLEPLGDMPAVDNLNVHLVTKEGLKQTQIRLGRPGVQRKTDDFLVLRATSQILGGSGASRLMQRVRDDLGLTYGVYSAFDFRKDKGTFYITTFTKNESVGQTLKETIDVYNKFVQEGANEKELDAAKAQMIGQFPRALETPDLYAYNILVLDFYEIPFSYLENYIDNVQKITVADVNNAIKKYLPENKLSVLIYGDEKQIANQLTAYKPEVTKASTK